MKEFNVADGWYWFLLAAAVCYLIGCFNFAVLISRFKKKDIREFGSGNPGTMNMTRTFGMKIGVLNFFCDGLKGGLPVLAGYLIFRNYVFAGTAVYENGAIVGGVLVSDFARYFFGVFVIIGHIFPVTLKFKGGKGIASTFGIFVFSLCCEQWWFLPILIIYHFAVLGYIALTEWGSMGSLLGVSLLTVWQAVILVLKYSGNLLNGWVIATFGLLLLINVLTWTAHRKNIFKLLAGEEHRTSVIKHKNSF